MPPEAVTRGERPTRVFVATEGKWAAEGRETRLRQAVALLPVWARREFRVRYRQSVLGVAWSVLQPAATLAIYGTLLHGALHVGSEGLPYLSYTWSALALWAFFANCANNGTSSLLGASSITNKIYFPREVVPLSVVGAHCVDLAIGLAITFFLVLAQGVGLSVALFVLPLPVLALMLWAAAIATVLSTLTLFVRDLRLAVPFVLQMLLLATPVVYPPSVLPHRFHWVLDVNPLAVIVTASRDVILRHDVPHQLGLLVLHTGLGAVALVLALLYVRSVEPRFADVA